MKKIFLSTGLFILALGTFIYWAGHNYLVPLQSGVIGKLVDIQSRTETSQEIRILTWNISYFYGLGSEGSAYKKRSKESYTQKLNSAGKLIKELKVDLVFLQEVDLDANRSHHVDQLKALAQASGLPYYAYAVSWEANYVPYPYLGLGNQFGTMSSGGGVLSRYPILINQVRLLDKPRSNFGWYNHLYPYRYLQKLSLKIGKETIKILNVHLEAFDKNNRQEQVERILKLHQKDPFQIIAGDFNLLPDNAQKHSGFPGYAEDDYRNDRSYSQLAGLKLNHANVSDFTFPSHRPDRKLDYIFYDQNRFTLKSSEVINTNESDHLPLMAILNFN